MPTGGDGVFGHSSEDEEDNVKSRGEKALRTLRELQKEDKTGPASGKDVPDVEDDASGFDNEEAEMARLRNAPKYLQFEKKHGRDKSGSILKKRIRNDINCVSQLENETGGGIEDIAPFPDAESIVPDRSQERNPSKRAKATENELPDANTDEIAHNPPGRPDTSRSQPGKNGDAISGKSGKRKRTPPRRKLDPKIIDDSSDSSSSSSSSDSDAGELGPQFAGVAAPAPPPDLEGLPLGEEAVLGTPHGGYVASVSVDPAGARLVSGSHDGTLKFWDFNSMDARLRAFKSTELFSGAPVRGAEFSATGGHLLAWGGAPTALVLDRDGASLAQTAPGDMYLVDAARARGHAGPVRRAEWLGPPGGGGGARQVATVATEGTVRVWDVDRAAAQPMHDAPVMPQARVVKLRNARGGRAVAHTFAAVGGGGGGGGARRLVAVGCDDRAVKVVDLRQFALRPAQEFGGVVAPGAEFTSIAEAPEAPAAPLLLVRSTDDALRVLDRRMPAAPVAQFLGLPNSVSDTHARFIGAGARFFATGTSASRRGAANPARIVVFSARTMTRVWEKEVEQGAGSVVGIFWHRKLEQVFYGCGDGSVRALYSGNVSSGGVMKCVIRAEPDRAKNSLWVKS